MPRRTNGLSNVSPPPDTLIDTELYRRYADNFLRAADSVMQKTSPREQELANRFHANLSRFAAYKAYHAMRQVRETVQRDGVIEDGQKVRHAMWA